jgi:hypothetical protein
MLGVLRYGWSLEMFRIRPSPASLDQLLAAANHHCRHQGQRQFRSDIGGSLPSLRLGSDHLQCANTAMAPTAISTPPAVDDSTLRNDNRTASRMFVTRKIATATAPLGTFTIIASVGTIQLGGNTIGSDREAGNLGPDKPSRDPRLPTYLEIV